MYMREKREEREIRREEEIERKGGDGGILIL